MSSFFVVGVSDCSLKFLMMALVSFSLADGFGLFESTIQSFANLSVSVHWNGPFLVLSGFLYIPVFLQLIATELLAIPYRRYIKNPHIIHAADSGQVISSTLDKMLQNLFVIVNSFLKNVEIKYFQKIFKQPQKSRWSLIPDIEKDRHSMYPWSNWNQKCFSWINSNFAIWGINIILRGVETAVAAT